MMCVDVELGNRAFGGKLRSLRPGHKSFWNLTKIIKNKCRSVTKLNVNGVTLITEQEKASAIAEKFSRAHENTVQFPLSTVVGESCSVLHDNKFNVNPSALTFPGVVGKAFKGGKAPGFNDVPNIILNNKPRRAFVYLTYVFNACIKLCYFPKIWKHVSVIPIPKPGRDHSNPSNYRPISLLSSISLVFERITLNRLNSFISTINILLDRQFGFRVAHSTSHQLGRVVRHVKAKRSLRVPESTGMLLKKCSTQFGTRLFSTNFW
jgi:hypothetical protein